MNTPRVGVFLFKNSNELPHRKRTGYRIPKYKIGNAASRGVFDPDRNKQSIHSGSKSSKYPVKTDQSLDPQRQLEGPDLPGSEIIIEAGKPNERLDRGNSETNLLPR